MSALIVLQDCATIQLSKGHNTLVDASEWDRLAVRSWHALRSKHLVYAARTIARNGRWPKVLLHHEVYGDVPDGMMIDHESRDTLDNRRGNLRLATSTSNHGNSRKRAGVKPASSRFKGVAKTGSGKWASWITKNGIRTHLGTFVSEVDAAHAYDAAALATFGEFAETNRDLYGDY